MMADEPFTEDDAASALLAMKLSYGVDEASEKACEDFVTEAKAMLAAKTAGAEPQLRRLLESLDFEFGVNAAYHNFFQRDEKRLVVGWNAVALGDLYGKAFTVSMKCITNANARARVVEIVVASAMCWAERKASALNRAGVK